MSKDPEGKAGRLGDETRARINDLKGGWKLPDAAADEKPSTVRPEPRAKQPSVPPPPPRAPRVKGASVPPPSPMAKPASAKRPTLPPAPIVSTIGAEDDAPTRLSSIDEPLGMAPMPASGPSGKATGTVRLPDSIPRETGFWGDISYVFRVLAKRRSARLEMEDTERRIASEKEARNTKLLEYGRHAVGDDAYDQTLVGRARAVLLQIEEKRSLHAGRIASANEKVAALERQRSEVKAKRAADIAKLELEIKAVTTSLEPLMARASAARRRTAKLRQQLQSINEQIRNKEASLVAVEGAADKASVHAEMASLQAERETVAADEPAIAAEIDELEPKIASLASSKGELAAKIEELRAEEELDVVRAAEKADAVKASRVVEERAVRDQAARQEKHLLELGEGLHHNPPSASDPMASAIMRHDLEIGTLERRNLELSELIGSVERGPMVRGGIYVALMVLLPVALGVYLFVLR